MNLDLNIKIRRAVMRGEFKKEGEQLRVIGEGKETKVSYICSTWVCVCKRVHVCVCICV